MLNFFPRSFKEFIDFIRDNSIVSKLCFWTAQICTKKNLQTFKFSILVIWRINKLNCLIINQIFQFKHISLKIFANTTNKSNRKDKKIGTVLVKYLITKLHFNSIHFSSTLIMNWICLCDIATLESYTLYKLFATPFSFIYSVGNTYWFFICSNWLKLKITTALLSARAVLSVYFQLTTFPEKSGHKISPL